MARRCLGLVLVAAAVLLANGCKHKKGSEVREAYPCCAPVVIDGGCGCGGGAVLTGGSYYGGGQYGGGRGDCGCGH